MGNTRPAVGQIVRFTSTHPSAPGVRMYGYVRDVGSLGCPRNPSVDTRIGGHQLFRRDWGTSVIVIREGATYADYCNEFDPPNASGRLRDFAQETGSVTPPGMLLLAVLRAADAPLSVERASRCVSLLVVEMDERTFAGDVVHARASGLIVETSGLWMLGTDPRVAALLASMPDDGDIARAAAVALAVA